MPKGSWLARQAGHKEKPHGTLKSRADARDPDRTARPRGRSQMRKRALYSSRCARPRPSTAGQGASHPGAHGHRWREPADGRPPRGHARRGAAPRDRGNRPSALTRPQAALPAQAGRLCLRGGEPASRVDRGAR